MWKFVADGYEVSTDGQVRSWKSGEPKILKLQLGTTGYLIVDLQIDGKRKMCKVHRLVAQAFIPNPLNLPQVNHINGVKTDNRVENLEWVTQSENNRHAYATGLKVAPQGEKSYSAKLTNEQAVWCRAVYKPYDSEFGAAALAKKLGVSAGVINAITTGNAFRNVGGRILKVHERVPDELRDEIRRLYVRGSREFGSTALAKKFNVDPQTILNIVREVSGDV